MLDILRADCNSHLRELVDEAIAQHGDACSLNHIDVSKVSDFSNVFAKKPFNGDISQWNPRTSTCMDAMFAGSGFNGDISHWRMPELNSAANMFDRSQFNGDISKWDVRNVRDFRSMFHTSAFSGDLSQWDMSKNAMQGGMFDASFKGRLPLLANYPDDECRTQEYETMFGGGDILRLYLAQCPFNHVHAAAVMDVPVWYPWLPKDDFLRLREFGTTALQLGMPPTEVMHAMVEHYHHHLPGHDTVSLEGMNLV